MDNVVLVGRKPTLTYVLSAVNILNTAGEVSIKARGRAISKAVDVAEIVRNRFVPNAEVKDIKIDTEELEGAQRKFVSTIEITLATS